MSAAACTTMSTPFEGAFQAVLVADVAEEVAQGGVVETGLAHLVLFELIPAVDDQLGRVVLLQHDLDEFLAKRTGSAGDQDDFIGPIHDVLLRKSISQSVDQLTR